VAPRGHEVELQRASVQRELERLPHGERRRRDEAAGRPAEPERAARRHRFDDPGAGPSHAPPAAAGVILMIYAVVWRRCYRTCLRACGYASRMRDSWSSV
jgi:hypothetical protein